MTFALGFTGPAGAGKTTLARALLPLLPGARLVSVSRPLKAMLAAYLAAAGADPDTSARMIDGDLKRAPSPLLGGRSPTHAMQTLGTEWGRRMMAPDLWSDLWKAQARTIAEAGGVPINDSVRFANEAAAVRALGGLVVRVEGRRDPRVPSHASERGVPPDLCVWNGPGARLEDVARAAFEAIEDARAPRVQL